MIDVIVAGGGPAGASLAILLARAGMEVELHDRARFPREKVCGEGLMPAGLAALKRLGVEVAGRPFRGVRYHAGGLTVEGPFPKTAGMPSAGLGVRRFRLDEALWGAAAGTAGVRALEDSEVLAPLIESGRVVGVRTRAGEHRARFVVGADGVHSIIRKRLGLDITPKRTRYGLRRHFRLANGLEPQDWVDVYLGQGHELYVTPVDRNEIQVAALSWRAFSGACAKRDYEDFLGRHPFLTRLLRGSAPVSDLAGMSPLSGGALRRFVPGCVLLGDAAGFLDPITGGGMTQAFLSAELLAANLARRFPPDEAQLRDFDRGRQKMLADYRRLTSMVLSVAERPALVLPLLRVLRAWPALFSHAIGVSGGVRRLIPGFRS